VRCGRWRWPLALAVSVGAKRHAPAGTRQGFAILVELVSGYWLPENYGTRGAVQYCTVFTYWQRTDPIVLMDNAMRSYCRVVCL
jgi:hypothetical protein